MGQSVPPTVTAAFDRDSVVIGDQFHLDVTIEKDMMQVVEVPTLTVPEAAPDVEILADYPLDTVSVDGRRQTLCKRYLVTIFNAGTYNLGRMPLLYADKNIVDTLLSPDSLRIVVAGFDIDLATDKPFDITPPRRFPLRFGEISGWLALGLVGVAIIVLLAWLFVKYRKRIPFLGGEKPVLPAHLLAIKKLEALRNQKLPQNHKVKQYYSGLTDILREYLAGRFGIPALEMTSEEIVRAVEEPRKEGLVDDKRFTDLRELLSTADLVKFAKYTPDEEYDETAYYNAYYFVEETKPVDDEGRSDDVEEDPLKIV
ncbi:MAG: hypothetical protein LBM63_00825 [Rikenellaceae bacterium]|nr:hypothetical protein [Rikenellaceae bacterium]